MDAADFRRAAIAALVPMPPAPTAPLSQVGRHALADSLESALAARLLPSPRHVALQAELTAAFTWSQRERPDSRTVVAVDGPYAVGKSGAVTDWAHRTYRGLLGDRVSEPRPRWSPVPGIDADLVPVVMLSLSGRQNASGIWRLILASLGHGYTGIADEIEIRARRALATHGVRLLIIDDVHMLNTRLIQGRATLDGLKTLNDALSRAGGTLVVVGAEIADGDLLRDPQISGRASTLQLRPYATSTKPEIAEWQRLIKTIEPTIAAYLPDAGAHCLLPHARILWTRSQGHVRDLAKLLTQSLAACIRDGRHSITAADIAAVALTKRATDQEALHMISPARAGRPGRTVARARAR